MLFGMVSGVGGGMGYIRWDGDRRSRMGSFGVTLGRPVATNGTLRRGSSQIILGRTCFYRAMHFSAKRGIAIVCRLSVCL